MKAKRSAGLLVGLLLLGLLAALSQTADVGRAVCPPLEDRDMQFMLEPSAWVRADWNANAKQWQIRCSEMDSWANMAGYVPDGMMNMNAVSNGAVANRPPRRAPAKTRPHEE